MECLGTRYSERLANVTRADQLPQIRRDLLLQTLDYYRGFVGQAKDNPELRADLALTYSKIGTLSREIGSNADAIDADTQAIRLFRELVAANPRDADYRRRLGVCQNNLALVFARSGRTDERDRHIRKQSAFRKKSWAATDNSGECLADLALAHGNLGLLQNEMGDTAGAAASLARAVELQEQLLGAAPEHPERLRDLAVTLDKLGALHAPHQPAKAIELYERAVALQKKAMDLQPEEPVYRSELALTYNNLGVVQSRGGAVAQAAESYARVVDLASELGRRWPEQKSFRRTLALGFNNLGATQRKLGHATAAEQSFRQALALQETLVKQDPRNLDLQSTLGVMYNDLGIVLEELNRTTDAAEAYQQAVAHQQQAVASAPANGPLSAVSQQALRQLRPGVAAHGTPRRRRPGGFGTTRVMAQLNTMSSTRLRLECLETRNLLSAIGPSLLPPVTSPSLAATSRGLSSQRVSCGKTGDSGCGPESGGDTRFKSGFCSRSAYPGARRFGDGGHDPQWESDPHARSAYCRARSLVFRLAALARHGERQQCIDDVADCGVAVTRNVGRSRAQSSTGR